MKYNETFLHQIRNFFTFLLDIMWIFNIKVSVQIFCLNKIYPQNTGKRGSQTTAI